jgi:2'-5' RNA ligase
MKQRFFLALLPPQEVQQLAKQIQQHFAEVYQSRAAQKSPPHITLQPPFDWQSENLPILQQKLTEFSQTQPPIPMTLEGFGAFKPRVIYIRVLKTPELLEAQKHLNTYLETSLNIVHEASKHRAFSPHLTVAYRDLSKLNFYKAWPEFASQAFHFEFVVPQLTLLSHNGECWQIEREFLLAP